MKGLRKLSFLILKETDMKATKKELEKSYYDAKAKLEIYLTNSRIESNKEFVGSYFKCKVDYSKITHQWIYVKSMSNDGVLSCISIETDSKVYEGIGVTFNYEISFFNNFSTQKITKEEFDAVFDKAILFLTNLKGELI